MAVLYLYNGCLVQWSSIETELMQGEDGMSKVTPVESSTECELEEDKKSEKVDKLDKLGMLCMSLGLQPSRMTDKMLNTIELSKDIERSQRNAINKLSSTSPHVERGQEEEQEEEEQEEEADRDEIVQVEEDGDSNAEQGKDMRLNTLGKSLKRKKIPPPLSISETNSATGSVRSSVAVSATSYQFEPDASFARSAPAHIQNFPRSSRDKRSGRVEKPSVQYLGRVPTTGPRRNSPIQSTHAYKLKTPYVPQFPRYALPGPPPPAMTPCAPYYPYMYPGQFPVYPSAPQQPYSPAMMAPWQPRSAMPYSSQARYYQDPNPRGKRPKQHNQQQEKKPAARKPDQDVRTSDADSSSEDAPEEQPDDSGNMDDTESVHLAIEDNATAFPARDPRPPNVLGEIRISGNVFSYDFPCNSPNIDKKMFMSICDKVWDESRRLTDNFSP